MNGGYLTLARWQGVPIRAHWTLPIIALYFSGWAFAPMLWLAFFALILIHEMGHAILVKAFRQHVFSIDLTGFGGLCRWVGTVTAIQRSMIAWGGVLAQLALYVATTLWTTLVPPDSAIGAEIAYVFTHTNLYIMAFNLIPIAPLDGAEAWSLIPLLRARWRTRRAFEQRRSPPPKSPPPGAPKDRSELDTDPADDGDATFKKVLHDVLNVDKPER
jgi:Zn-dependent protease